MLYVRTISSLKISTIMLYVPTIFTILQYFKMLQAVSLVTSGKVNLSHECRSSELIYTSRTEYLPRFEECNHGRYSLEHNLPPDSTTTRAIMRLCLPYSFRIRKYLK
jgi:hypothetical protein